MKFWQTLGNYEHEVECTDSGGSRYTGWVRCVGGRLADGTWPSWNSYTGEKSEVVV